MPRKKGFWAALSEFKKAREAFSSLHKLPFLSTFIAYLNEVDEGNWEERTRNLIRASGRSEQEATDRSLWFRDPAFCNGDGSSEISWKTIRNYRDLIREPLKLAALGLDSGSSAFGLIFFMLSAFAYKRDLNAPAYLRTMKESLQKPGEFEKNLYANTQLGVLDLILPMMILLLVPIHQDGRLGWCPECGKLFIREHRNNKIWCTSNCRDRVYNRKGAKGRALEELEKYLAVTDQNLPND